MRSSETRHHRRNGQLTGLGRDLLGLIKVQRSRSAGCGHPSEMSLSHGTERCLAKLCWLVEPVVRASSRHRGAASAALRKASSTGPARRGAIRRVGNDQAERAALAIDQRDIVGHSVLPSRGLGDRAGHARRQSAVAWRHNSPCPMRVPLAPPPAIVPATLQSLNLGTGLPYQHAMRIDLRVIQHSAFIAYGFSVPWGSPPWAFLPDPRLEAPAYRRGLLFVWKLRLVLIFSLAAGSVQPRLSQARLASGSAKRRPCRRGR